MRSANAGSGASARRASPSSAAERWAAWPRSDDARGVGRLRLIDRDFVEWSNLQRQFLFEESDAAEAAPKAAAAARRLNRVNSEVELEPMVADFTASNAGGVTGRNRSHSRWRGQFRNSLPSERRGRALRRSMDLRRGGGQLWTQFTIVPGRIRRACAACIPIRRQSPQATCETEGVLAPVTATIAAPNARTR